MSEITELLDLLLPEDVPNGEDYSNHKKIEKDIIDILADNKFTISETRHMFNSILRRFERHMPVTNKKKLWGK